MHDNYGMKFHEVNFTYNRICPCIIRTVVRIVGMGRMSHICNTKCSRL